MKKLELFSAAVDAIHGAAAAPQEWPEALRAVMALFEVERGALLELGPENETLDSMVILGYDPAVQREYAEHYFSLDPVVGLPVEALLPYTSYEHFDARIRAKSEFFDFVRRSGAGDSLQVMTGTPAERRMLLSVQRNRDGAAFDEDAKALLALLGPHLQGAHAVQTRLREAELARLGLEAGLDAVASPAFIIDGKGWIQHLNAAASQFVKAHPGAVRLSGVLAFVDSAANEVFRNALQEAAARERARAQVVRLDLGLQDKTEVVLAPLQPREGAAWTEPLVLVVVAQCTLDGDALAWRMRELYQLSAAEARVAAAIALGRTVEDIASATGVKEVTLRTQLRSIFQKTGTTRQVELVRVALSASAFRLRR
jgi:DNA-binding NarL/FixJ family response regulator